MARKLGLSLLFLLLSVDVAFRVLDFAKEFRPGEARAQAAATPTGEVAIATVQGPGSQAWVFLYDVLSQRLAAYEAGNQCIELKGVRQVTWDLKLHELPSSLCGKKISVKDMKELTEKL